MALLDPKWLPPAKLARIIIHWTAGTWKASGLDQSHYHFLIEADGRVVKGGPGVELNQAPARKGYAAHTLNCNSGSIGVSLCGMMGATESPFNAGKYPLTEKQFEVLFKVVAELCDRYKILVGSTTVLTHAEVQNNLGIKQRGKWDIARMPHQPGFKGAKAVGDYIRAHVLEEAMK